MTMISPRLVVAAVAAAMALPAAAQVSPDPHVYIGGSVGRTSLSDDREQFGDQFLDLGFNSASTASDTKDTGYRAFVGYMFLPYLGVEGAYVDLGKFEAHTVVDPAGTFTGKTDIKGPELSLVGRFPIGDQFAIYGRAGMYRGKVTTHYTGTGSVELATGEDTQTHKKSHASYALGVSYDFSPHFGSRLEWARYTKMGDDYTGGVTDADLVSLGLTYSF